MFAGNKMAKLLMTFFVGSALPKILIFLLLPIYTRTLPADEYGYFDVSITYGTIISSFFYMDIWVATLKFMLKGKGESQESIIGSGILIFFISTLLLTFICAYIDYAYEVNYIWLVFAYCMTTCLRDFYGYVSRGKEKHSAFMLSGLIGTVVSVFLNYYFLVISGQGVYGLYVATIIGNLVQIAIVFYACNKNDGSLSRLAIKRSIAVDLLLFSLPLGFNSIVYWVLTGYGKIIIQESMDFESSGYFAIGGRFGVFVLVLLSVVNMAWQDISFSYNKEDRSKFYSNAISTFPFILAAGVSAALLFVSIVFMDLIGKEYHLAYSLVPGFFIASYMGAINSFLGNMFYALGVPKFALITNLIALALALSTTGIMVDEYGMDGANYSLILAFSLSFLLRLISLKMKIGIILPVKKLIYSAFMGVSSSVIYIYLEEGFKIISFVALSSIFFISIYLELKAGKSRDKRKIP